MRKGIDKIIAIVLAVTLLTAGVHAGHHESLDVAPENKTVKTVDNTTSELSFTVNNTADRPVQNAKLTVTNHSDTLALQGNETIILNRLNASEEQHVAVTIEVPGGTDSGNYSVSVAVQEGNHTVDNATVVVMVGKEQPEATKTTSEGKSDRSGEDAGGESSEKEETKNGGTGGIMAEENDPWYVDLFDGELPDFDFDFSLPDWDLF